MVFLLFIPCHFFTKNIAATKIHQIKSIYFQASLPNFFFSFPHILLQSLGCNRNFFRLP